MAVEYKKIEGDELEALKQQIEMKFESAQAEGLSEEACGFLADICANAIEEDFDWMLQRIVINGALVYRNWNNPVFTRYLRRAYEHGVACGDAGCCCNLGNMYHGDDALVDDIALAEELYQLGAERGDGQAAVNLGYIYYYGRGEEGVNYTKAFKCYSHAVFIEDNTEALWKLGDMYAKGQGVTKNEWMAWTLYSRAYNSSGRSTIACRAAHHMADMLMRGIEASSPQRCIEPDPERALRLYVEAEIGYQSAIDSGLTYYARALRQAIEGQQAAHAAIEEMHRKIREGAIDTCAQS